MEAKDTVMSDRDLLRFELKYSREDTFYWGAAFDAALKAQAEITWPIAHRQGMREVVEWIGRYSDIETHINMHHEEEWTAFLEEKGLSNGHK